MFQLTDDIFFSLENNFYSLHQREKDRDLPKSNMNTQQCEGKKSHSAIGYIHQVSEKKKNIPPLPLSPKIFFRETILSGSLCLIDLLKHF